MFNHQGLVAKYLQKLQLIWYGELCPRKHGSLDKILKFQESHILDRKIEHMNFNFFMISISKLIYVSILIFVLGVWFSFYFSFRS